MGANISSTHKDQVWVTEESVKTEKRGLKRQRRRRKWQPTPVFLPGKSHGQRRLEGYSPWGGKESEVAEHACMYACREKEQLKRHILLKAFREGVLKVTLGVKK